MPTYIWTEREREKEDGEEERVEERERERESVKYYLVLFVVFLRLLYPHISYLSPFYV